MNIRSLEGINLADFRQSLNFIALSGHNIRIKIEPTLSHEDSTYADRKMTRIEAELGRMSRMLDAYEDQSHSNQDC